MVIKDEVRPVRVPLAPANVRKGRFMWMPENDRQHYLDALREKISRGFFFSDPVMSDLVNDLAPVLNDTVDRDRGPSTIWESFAGIAMSLILPLGQVLGSAIKSIT